MKIAFVNLLFFCTYAGISFGQIETNSPGAVPGIQKAIYTSPIDGTSALDNILIYADDQVHTAPNTFPDQALQNLGLSYSAFYNSNFADFETALVGSSWDLIIFAADTWGPPASTSTALLTYIENGGKIIFHTWQYDAAIFNALGASLISGYFLPVPVYWWQLGHRIFSSPNNVPELINTNTAPIGVYGYYVSGINEFDQLAGYTTPGPNAAQECLLLNNNGKTIFKGFLDSQFSQDLNSNSKPDMVELYENMIGYISNPPVVPISNWALGIGIFLIAATTLISMRRFA